MTERELYIFLGLYFVMSLVTGVLVQTSWRRRGIPDAWGPAMALGTWWPFMLPVVLTMILRDRRASRKDHAK
jgi:hypothetical protein